MPLFHGDAALAGWKKVVDEVHAAGGRIAPQLTHVGQKRSSTAPDWTAPAPYESPSGLAMTGERVGEPMSETDIADTVDAFARAAADAERLGFDGVELLGNHNYLINNSSGASSTFAATGMAARRSSSAPVSRSRS
jgi:2,4-dienoyl-CoA reductase-like NADH-dependent reductase (Old Yellow Enzyme family)